MNFYAMCQAIAPFTVLCLFFFFWRMKRMENTLLAIHQRYTEENRLLAKALSDLQREVAAIKETEEPMDEERKTAE